MAKGKECPYCKKIMYAEQEKIHPVGSDVIYYCNKCDFRERVFENLSKKCPKCHKDMQGSPGKTIGKTNFFCMHCNWIEMS